MKTNPIQLTLKTMRLGFSVQKVINFVLFLF